MPCLFHALVLSYTWHIITHYINALQRNA